MKLFMRFDQDFYPDAFAAVEDYTDEEETGERLFYDETWGQDSRNNILGMFMIGDPAERFVGLSDIEVVSTVLEELDEVFDGQASLHFDDAFYQDWSSEEFIRGSYSIYIDYNYVSVMKRLERPLLNRLFFAGEHLPPDYFNHGYVHGAALSGRKQANAIMGKSGAFTYGTSPTILVALVGAVVLSLL
jgi:monoamine oxidase